MFLQKISLSSVHKSSKTIEICIQAYTEALIILKSHSVNLFECQGKNGDIIETNDVGDVNRASYEKF